MSNLSRPLGNTECSPCYPPRAQRFDLHLPLRYRAGGETAWWEGRTENISYTGVLFRAERLMQVGTHIEMRLEMSLKSGGGPAARVLCAGEIVRIVGSERDTSERSLIGLAARIVEYDLVPGSRLDALGDPAAGNPAFELTSERAPPFGVRRR